MNEVSHTAPQIRFLVLSAHYEPFIVRRVRNSVAMGFVDKLNSPVSELGRAISVVLDGKCYFSPSFLAAELETFVNLRDLFARLTEAQCRVLELIAEGYNDTTIATRLRCSTHTIRSHRGCILRALNIGGTPQLMAYARKLGIPNLSIERK